MKADVNYPIIIKKYVYCILLLVTKYSLLFAQNDKPFIVYNQAIYQAEKYVLAGNYQGAATQYAKAFNQPVNPFNFHLLAAAKVSRKAKERDSIAKEFISQALTSGLSRQKLKHTIRKRNLYSIELRREILDEYDSLHNIYIKSLNKPLLKKIKRIIKRDRRSRNFWGLLTNFQKKDLINFQEILVLCENDSWPEKFMMGDFKKSNKLDITGRISLLFHHFSSKQIQVMEPYLIKAMEAGLLTPNEYAGIIDYDSIGVTRKQKYGTYIQKSSEKRILTVSEPEKVNSRRAAIGLEPIEDYAKRRGAIWE